MKIRVVVGNPSAGGRTTTTANAVASAIGALFDNPDIATIELSQHIDGLFTWKHDTLDQLNADVADADVIVAATPNYKSSYTGLMKAFFDRYGDFELAGTITIPVMVGAAPTQAMAVEMHMRPLFVALGSSLPTQGLYVLADTVDDIANIVDRWMTDAGPILKKALA